MSLLNNKCPAGTNWVPQRKSVVLLAEVFGDAVSPQIFFRCNYLFHYKRRGGSKSFRRGAFFKNSKERGIFHLPHSMDKVYAKSVNILFLL